MGRGGSTVDHLSEKILPQRMCGFFLAQRKVWEFLTSYFWLLEGTFNMLVVLKDGGPQLISGLGLRRKKKSNWNEISDWCGCIRMCKSTQLRYNQHNLLSDLNSTFHNHTLIIIMNTM